MIMLEITQLKQLLTFAECGTLSKAAEELHISQPSLSRTMQQIEAELGVSLFERQKNRLILNENGLLAVEYARKVIDQLNDMVLRVRSFDRMSRTISIGSCAPIPGAQLVKKLRQCYPDMTISSEIKPAAQLKAGLMQDIYQFIILPAAEGAQPDMSGLSDSCAAVPLSAEHLMFALPKDHPEAGAESLHLSDINGQNMIVMPNLGFWREVIDEKMPDSRFLVQTDRVSFEELIQASGLPYFTTDLVIDDYPHPQARIFIPISDPEVNVTFYFVTKEKDRKKFSVFFRV